MSHQQVMAHRERCWPVLDTGRKDSLQMSENRRDPRLVDRDPVLHAVAESVRHERRILGKPRHRVPIRPTAALLKCLGKIPVVESEPWLDPTLEESVNKPFVELEA